MSSVFPVLLFGLAGILAGGTYTLFKQGAGKLPLIVLGTLSLLAMAGGVMWLLPGNEA